MTEYEIVERFRRGEKEFFDEIVELYRSRGLRTAYLILGNRADAEDVLQDTFLKIYLNISQLKNVGAFSSWFYKVLIRTCHECFRKKKREFADDEIWERKETGYDGGLDKKIIQNEVNREIREIVNSLSLEQRTAIILFYYQGFSIKEIADVTGSFETTVKSRLFLARKKLKTLLSGNVQEA